MTELVLGPVLRYVSDTEATVWVETADSCEVEVLDHRAHTFGVEGHHYALVCIEGLEPGRTYEYGVSLDGEDPLAGIGLGVSAQHHSHRRSARTDRPDLRFLPSRPSASSSLHPAQG
jgi:hypothetical protein